MYIFLDSIIVIDNKCLKYIYFILYKEASSAEELIYEFKIIIIS